MLHYLVFFGAAINLSATIFYIRAIFRGHARPNRVTYCMWSVAPLIATVAALSQGVRWAVLPVFMAGFSPLLIFSASWMNPRSYWKLGAFDYWCGSLSALALILWFITKEANIAIAFAVASDGFAGIPTLTKSWRHPESEFGIAYVISMVNIATSFAAMQRWDFSELAFPLYLIVMDSSIVFAIYRSKILNNISIRSFLRMMSNFKRKSGPESCRGYAALTAILLIVFSSLAIVGGLAFFAVQEAGINRAYGRSLAARAAAEAGIEDGTYRILAGKQIGSSESLAVGSDTTTITIATVGSQRTIRSAGVHANIQQNLETRVSVTTDAASFHYGVQVGDGGMTMNNGAQVIGNVHSNGSISGGTVTGDATVAGGITADPQLQWATNDADQFFATSAANRDIAQSFTAPATGSLNKVSVYLAKVGSPTANITLRITRDSNGKPDRNGELTNATIAVSQVGTTASWIDISLANPPSLVNGTKYWIVLDYGSNSATNYWNWRKDATDGYAGNTGRYANDWNSSSATWVNVGGDLSFRVWVGGVNTKIADMTIGGTGRANLFDDVIAGGASCPNANCIVENPSRKDMPISEGVIQDWRDDAAAGGVCAPPLCDGSGNLTISNGASQTVGPLKISGNLTMSNNAHLTITGTVWVAGTISFSNNCTVALSAGYGNNSGVIITDGTATISNNCIFSGSGTAGSYLMLLDAKNDPTHQVMNISNSSTGVIYYAQNGRIHLSNNAGAKEVTAYGIDMDNNATVTYESGLVDTQFSSGPSGGYAIEYWKQVP